MLIVIDQVLNAKEAHELRDALKGAAWVDGKSTAGDLSAVVKRNRQLPEGADLTRAAQERVVQAVSANPMFLSAALPEKIYPPKFNRYAIGESYGVHVDSAIMRAGAATIRTDLSATLFLCEPEEYEGGVLTIEGKYGAQEVKLNAGDLVLYPANSLHQVTPVASGERICAFFWVQSMVPDGEAREMLFDLDQSIQALRMAAAPQEEIVRLSAIYNNLLRRWAQV